MPATCSITLCRRAFSGLGLLFFAIAIEAQTAPATKTTPAGDQKGDLVTLSPMTVTGSVLRRLDQENVLPVTVFTHDMMEARDAVTPVELLTALPQITNVPLNESASGGANSRGDNANINLRGVGSGHTLVLLNGRRIAPHPVTSNDAGVPAFYANVNQLPTQGLERIDVLRDGASSLYGSDAIAGVVNFITRRDFRGTELRTRLGAPEHGGGQSFEGTLTHGREFAGGKGRWLSTLDYLWRDSIRYSQRDFTQFANHTAAAPAPFNVVGSSFDGRSSVGIYPAFRIGTATTANYFRPVNGNLAFTAVSPTANVANRLASPEFFLNSNQYQNVGQNQTVRQNWFNHVEYDLSANVTAFVDFSIYHAHAFILRPPLSINAPGSDQFGPLSIDNPFNPYGSRFYSPTGAPNADGTPRLTGAARAITLTAVSLKDVGPETINVRSGVSRGVAGLRGKLAHDWNWETAALYTRAYTADISNNAVRESLFDRALLRPDATAFNPFGYSFKVAGNAVVPDQPSVNPKSVLDTFVQVWRHDGFSALTSLDGRTAGPIFNYWGNIVSLAVGGEYRHEQFLDLRPAYAGSNPPGSGLNLDDNDYLAASYAPNSTGNRVVYGAYTEAVIPVVSPARQFALVHSLELTGSARYEHYSDFGTTTRPKAGLNWRPNRGLMVRGSFNEGFSAPNLPTLYAPTRFTTDSAPGVVDTYRNQTLGEGAYVMKRYTTGNRGLKAVTSIGKSAGIVLDVPKVKGLTVTADYWQIEQANVIGSYSDAQLLNSDVAKLNAYTQSQLAAGRTIAQIDAGAGTNEYKGDPGIARNAPTAQDLAAFATYNAAKPAAQQATAVGPIASRSIRFQNLTKGYASGVDLSLSYQVPTLPLGKLSLSTDWAYLVRSYQLRDVPGSVPSFIERMNVDGATRWRGTTSIAWRKGNWNAGVSGYYLGRFADATSGASAGASTNVAAYNSLGAPGYLSKQFDSGTYLYRYVVHDSVTFNAFVGRSFGADSTRWLRGSRVRLGVVNLSDRKPPLTSGAAGYATSIHGALLAGRTWTWEMARRF